MRPSLLFAFFAAAALVCTALAMDSNQQPIPAKYGSSTIGNPAAPLILEMHGDLLCPDCRDAWLNVISVLVNEYAPKNQLFFVYHVTPLPFHTWSHTAAWAAYTCEAVKPGVFHDFADAVYAVQDSFSNNATAAMNVGQVVSMLGAVCNQFGVSTADFMSEFKNPAHDMQARVSWKVGMARGVFGTPMFFLNGVRVLDQDFVLQDWRNLLDSLLN
eukprot:ANDGO_05355.mRNA.1 hypothetical protein CAOG_04686